MNLGSPGLSRTSRVERPLCPSAIPVPGACHVSFSVPVVWGAWRRLEKVALYQVRARRRTLSHVVATAPPSVRIRSRPRRPQAARRQQLVMGMGWSFDWRRTKVEPEPEELYTERINKSDARQPPPTVETDGIASVTTPISTINY